MRVAHLADLHLGKRTDADPKAARRLAALRYAIDAVVAEGVEAILVAGDVFDDPGLGEEIICPAARILGSARTNKGEPIPTVVIPGNHDPADATQLWSTFKDAMPADSALQVVENADCAELCDGRLVVEAYPCQSRYSPVAPWAERVTRPAAAARVPHVVLAHGTLLGGQVPEAESDAYPFTLAEAEALGADYVALGHFHGVYPAWNGNEFVERGLCYAGTHEPDQFGSDSGWVIVAELEKGRPARLRRIAVGRLSWQLIEIAAAADLARLAEFKSTIERHADPASFVLRLKLDRAQLSPSDVQELEATVAELGALGTHVDQRGHCHTLVDPAQLDLSAFPEGAMQQALAEIQEEWSTETDERRREVLSAALQIGSRFF